MGRYKDSGLGIGAAGSPQGNISQIDAEVKAEELSKFYSPFDSSKLIYNESKEKYEGYLLNFDHPIGDAKAKFLKQTLGYSKADSEKLHKEICKAVNNKIPYSVDSTLYGIKTKFKVKLNGSNEKYGSANVIVIIQNNYGESTWRIITIIPGEKEK